MLDNSQVGHIRHMRNLMAQPDGDWSHMDSMEAGQEGLSAYRYQLSHIVYALGLAHYHHLPAAPCVFKDAIQAAIRKMLRREVWGYWFEASQSDKRIDPDLEERRTPRPDREGSCIVAMSMPWPGCTESCSTMTAMSVRAA